MERHSILPTVFFSMRSEPCHGIWLGSRSLKKMMTKAWL